MAICTVHAYKPVRAWLCMSRMALHIVHGFSYCTHVQYICAWLSLCTRAQCVCAWLWLVLNLSLLLHVYSALHGSANGAWLETIAYESMDRPGQYMCGGKVSKPIQAQKSLSASNRTHSWLSTCNMTY